MRARFVSFAFDAFCVLALVVVGTRNHETDTGVAAVLGVGVPFWIALVAASLLSQVSRDPQSTTAAATAWIGTVSVGMVLRNLVFDRGTAVPFVIVASLFLFATMFGWRAVARRRAHATTGS
ncbi:MAG: hypothetical protein RLY50_824 [Actinomycetota bacterium]